MLAQLVCLDRRYQRMNCFNMRELQALLKEKYFNDLVNNYDYRSNIFNSINLKYKLNDLSVIDNNISLFNNNGLHLTFFTKIQNFNNNPVDNLTVVNFNYFILTNYNTLKSLKNSLWLYVENMITHPFTTPYFRNCLEILTNNTFGMVLNVGYSLIFNTQYFVYNFFTNVKTTCTYLIYNNQLAFNFYYQFLLSDLVLNNKITTIVNSIIVNNTKFTNLFNTNNSDILISKAEHKVSLNDGVYFNNSIGESIENSKALRFNNPIFKYDYKLGNYLSKETINNFPHLMLSQTQVTGGIRKSSYVYSTHFIELFKTNINNYLSLFTLNNITPSFIEPEMRHISNTNSFYNLFLNYCAQSTFLNTH